MLEVRFLGPLDVLDGERAVAVGGGRQRALFAILALHPNEVVPAARLIDELWPDEAPDSALNTLQGYVSRLRKALDPVGANGRAIAYRSGGYILDISPEQIDGYRFAQLVERSGSLSAAGEVTAAADLLHEALGLWRGAALSDFVGEPFAQAEIARLEELRLRAVEDRIDADLACGRHGALVPELESLVAADPLRERLRGQLMLALYGSGRQGDALAAYRDARAALDDELGVEPTPALRELERAILRQDPSLAPPDGRRAPASKRRPRWSWILGAAAIVVTAVLGAGLVLPSGGQRDVEIVRNSVAVLDAETNELVDDVVVGDYPGPIAAGNDSVWVGNIGANTMTEIGARTREAEFPAGVQRPLDMAVTRDAIWVANATDFQTTPPTGGGTIERRELRAGALATTRLGPRTALDEGSTFVTSDGLAVWAGNVPSRTVVRLDPHSGGIVARVRGVDPSGLAIGYGSVWVAERRRRTVARIDAEGATITARIPISGSPTRVATGEGGVWVITDGPNSAVWRIDPQTNETVAVTPVPRTPRRVATGAGYVWVTSGRGDSDARDRVSPGLLSKIDPDTNRLVTSIRLGFRPDGVVVADGHVWVAVAPN